MKDYVVGHVVFNGAATPTSAVNGIRDWKIEHATCQKCGERPATETWSEGGIAFAHGLYQRWCKRCVVAAQITHAEQMAEQLPSLRALLETLA